MLATAAFVSPATATPTVTLNANLRPETLGASTNVSVGFRISTVKGQPPDQLRSFSLQLPPGMGFFSTSLGIATCAEQLLLSEGSVACPRESTMGSGEVITEAPFGAQSFSETAPASIFMTTANDGHTTMLFYFDGRIPVIATLVVPAEVLTPTGTSLSVISSQVPQITTAPGSEDLAILGLQMTIGSRHIVYYKRVHGRSVAYHPAGLAIPELCPKGGFVFGGNFSFADGSQVHNTAAVPCPAQAAARRGGRGRRRR
jgi:hypothetical protein